MTQLHISRVFRRRRHGARRARRLVALPVRQRLRPEEGLDLRSQLGRRRHQARRRRKPDLGGFARTVVDLAWASFPCQDLSLAGGYRGLGRERDNAPTRSGTFWPFWKLMRGLVEADRAPRTIVLENVYGCLTSHGGKDFAAIASALSDSGYKFGAAVINASHFVPQSRPRVFFIAVRKGEADPEFACRQGPQPEWHPAALIDAHAGMTAQGEEELGLVGYRKARCANLGFSDLLEDIPTGVKWHTAAHTQYLLELMTPLHRQKVARAMNSGRRTVGSIYRRTRPDENGSEAPARRSSLRRHRRLPSHAGRRLVAPDDSRGRGQESSLPTVVPPRSRAADGAERRLSAS